MRNGEKYTEYHSTDHIQVIFLPALSYFICCFVFENLLVS